MAPIVHALNSMLARLEAAFLRESRFSADVAHELRTPIATIMGYTELLSDREKLVTFDEEISFFSRFISYFFIHFFIHINKFLQFTIGDIGVNSA